jgi:hypothetical protein
MLKKPKRQDSTQTKQGKDMSKAVQVPNENLDGQETVQLSSRQLGQLLSLTNKSKNQWCPLPMVQKAETPDKDFLEMMARIGWISTLDQASEPVLSALAEQVLNSLLSPQTRVQLILGSLTELASTNLYSTKGYQDDQLTIYTFREDEDLHIIRQQLSPSDVSDALLASLLLGPHKEGFSFEVQLSDDVLVGYLAILDLLYARRLEAKLDGELYPQLNFTDKDLEKRFAEIRMGEDLLWLSVLVPYLFPYLDPQLHNGKTQALLDKIASQELLTPVRKGVYQPSDFTLALSEALIPLISYASIAITDPENSGLYLGFFIGPNTNVVMRFSTSDNGNLVEIKGMDGIKLSRLLYEIGLPEKKQKKIDADFYE